MTQQTPQRRRPPTQSATASERRHATSSVSSQHRDSAVPVNPRRRRRKRHPYAYLVKPALVFVAVLTLVILAVVDYNSYELTWDIPGELSAEYGEVFTPPPSNAVLKGGLFGIERKADCRIKGTVDVNALGQQTITYKLSCKIWWLVIPRTFSESTNCTVTVQDTLAPVITLNTSDEPTTFPSMSYVEEGYTALDNYDGDVTASVTSYEQDGQVFYSVTDSHGNTATEVRQIQYREGAEPNGKIIYLTFDDGPGRYTEELLDVLKKYNVKATFFVVNTDYTHIIKRIHEEGHAVAVHSYTHDYNKIYASESAFFSDVEKMQEIIVQNTGNRTNLLRFPGGSSNAQGRDGIMSRLVKEVGRKGYYYFDWNVDSKDAGGATTAKEVFENVKDGVSKRKQSVVLQHDIKKFSVDAVEMILQWGLENGYTFLPLDSSAPGCHHR